MQFSIDLEGLDKIARVYNALPKEIAKARRRAVNRTGAAIRKEKLLPRVRNATGIKTRPLQRTIELKRANRRRDFALIRTRYVRFPPQQWGQMRIRALGPTRGVVQVFNDVCWVDAYAFVNPSARSGAPVPLARYANSPGNTDLLEMQRQLVDLRDRSLLIIGGRGPSVAEIFSRLLSAGVLKEATDRLQIEVRREVLRAVGNA